MNYDTVKQIFRKVLKRLVFRWSFSFEKQWFNLISARRFFDRFTSFYRSITTFDLKLTVFIGLFHKLSTQMNALNDRELIRYSRQIVLKNWGVSGQQKLKATSVLIIGCGGLGNAVIPALAAAGFGKIGLVDFDSVGLSNLPRQLLFSSSQVNTLKVNAAAQRIKEINEEVEVAVFPVKFSIHAQDEKWRDYDMVIDATDNFETRYEIDQWCFDHKKPMIYGSVDGWIGQVSMFHAGEINQDGCFSYQGLYPEKPLQEAIGNCSTNGVVNTAAIIIGTIQANEAIKLALQFSDILVGKVLHFDALEMAFSIFNLNRRPFVTNDPEIAMISISAEELHDLFEKEIPLHLLDVRENYEHESINIGGELIPMNEIPREYTRISKDIQTVVICKSGIRSAHVIEYLKREHGFSNLANLHGGILDFAKKYPNNTRIKRA